MRIDYGMADQTSLFVKAGDLAPVAESGIHGHGPLLPDRSTQKQLPQVFSEHAYTLRVGFLLCLPDDFGADGRLQQALERIIHGLAYLLAQFP